MASPSETNPASAGDPSAWPQEYDLSVFDDYREDLEKHEFMMGTARGRLAVSLDRLTDALILIGQHGVYCTSSRNPSVPALDLQTVLSEIKGAKELVQSVMEELAAKK